MKFMIIVHPGDKKGYEAGAMPSDELLANMGKFNEQLVNAGVMKDGQGLHPTTNATRLHFSNGKVDSEKQGPFADSLIGGYWIWETKSKEEALAWARKAPMEENATLEIRQLFTAEDFGPEIAAQERELMERMKKQG